MQQWWEQEESNNVNSLSPTVEKKHKISKLLKETKMPVLKTFTVEADTIAGQKMCVSGNCTTLGNWEVKEAFVLTNTNVTCVKNK